MNLKMNLDDPMHKKLKTVETECSIFRRDTSGNESATRKSDAAPYEEEKISKKNPDATERIVFPLDLNDGKEDDNEMVDSTFRPLGNDNNKRRLLGMVPNLELALGEEKATPTMNTTSTTGVVLPFMAGTTTSIEEHRSSSSHKPRDEMVNQEDDAASLSLSLTFSSLEKQQQEEQNQKRSVSGWEDKKQNVNTPMFLFRGFPDKSS